MITKDRVISDLRYDELNMDLIHRINSKYNFKIKQLTHNRIFIESGTDEWFLHVDRKKHKDHKNLVLYHKNNYRDINKYHKQREFYTYDWVFDAIHNHEKWRIKKPNKIEAILREIKRNNNAIRNK